MSTFTELLPYLRPEFPKWSETESGAGWTWEYRYPAASLSRPGVGQPWANELPLTSVSETPSLDNSGYNELTVSDAYTVSSGGPEATTLEEVRYQLRWNTTTLPLVRHPLFAAGAAYDIFTAKSGKMPLEDIIGWEYEQDPEYKSKRKYRKLDSAGNPSATVTTVSEAYAVAFIKLRQLGFDSYTEYTPSWSKVSIYRGTESPGVSTIGQYVAGASVPELPTDLETFEYIKTADGAERIGTQARWQRTEEWTGYTKVYFDTDTMNPASHTLP